METKERKEGSMKWRYGCFTGADESDELPVGEHRRIPGPSSESFYGDREFLEKYHDEVSVLAEAYDALLRKMAEDKAFFRSELELTVVTKE